MIETTQLIQSISQGQGFAINPTLYLDYYVTQQMYRLKLLDLESVLLLNFSQWLRGETQFNFDELFNYFYNDDLNVQDLFPPLVSLYKKGYCNLSVSAIRLDGAKALPKESEVNIKRMRSLISSVTYLYLAVSRDQTSDFNITIDQAFLDKWSLDWDFVFNNLHAMFVYSNRGSEENFRETNFFSYYFPENDLMVEPTQKALSINPNLFTRQQIKSLKNVLPNTAYLYMAHTIDKNNLVDYARLTNYWEMSPNAIASALISLSNSGFINVEFKTAKLTWLKSVSQSELTQVSRFLLPTGKVFYLLFGKSEIDVSQFCTVNNLDKEDFLRTLQAIKASGFLDYELNSVWAQSINYNYVPISYEDFNGSSGGSFGGGYSSSGSSSGGGLGYSDGFQDGYNDGYQDGLANNRDANYRGGEVTEAYDYNSGYASGYNSGFNVGQSELLTSGGGYYFQ